VKLIPLDPAMIFTALLAGAVLVPTCYLAGLGITLPLMALSSSVGMLVLSYFETRSN